MDRRQVPWLLVASVSSVLLWTGGACGAGEKVIKAERFELLGKEGKTRAVLQTADDGLVSFTFLDKASEPRLVVGLSAEGGPSVEFRDKWGVTRLLIETREPDGSPRWALRDPAGTERAVVELTPPGVYGPTTPHLKLLDVDGKTRAELQVSTDSSPALQLHDGNEKIGLYMIVWGEHFAQLGLYNKQDGEDTRASISVTDHPGVSLTRRGQVAWSAP